LGTGFGSRGGSVQNCAMNRHAQRCAEVFHQGARGVSIFPLRFYPLRDKPDLVLNNMPRAFSYALKEARLP